MTPACIGKELVLIELSSNAKKKEELLAFSFCTTMFFIRITLPAGQRNNS